MGAAVAVGIIALASLLAACGGSDSKSSGGSSTTTIRRTTSTTARSSSSTTTTAAPNNCTEANLTPSLLPEMNPSALKVTKTAVTSDSKYAFLLTGLASGAPSNPLPALISCEAGVWKLKKDYTAEGIDCSTFNAAEKAAVAELASKTNAAWKCR